MLPAARNLREWILLGISLLLLVSLFVYEARQDRLHIMAEEKTRLTVLSQVVQEQINRQIESIDVALRSLRDRLPPRHATRSPQTQMLLETLAEAMPGVRNILMLDADGIVFASNNPVFIGKNFRSRDYFRISQADADPNKLYIIPPFRNSLGIWTTPLVRTLSDKNGQFAGIVAASIEAQELTSMLNAIHYASGVWAAIAHVDGKVFVANPAPPDLAKVNVRADPDSLPNRHLATGQDFSLQIGTGSAVPVESLVAIRNVKPASINTDKFLLLGVARSTEDLFARWRHETIQHALLYALLVAVCTTALHVVQRRRQAEAQVRNDYQKHLEQVVKRRTTELNATEQQMRLILESTGDGLIGIDVEGVVTFVNPAACALLGYAADDLLGRNMHATLHYRYPDGRPYPARECGLLHLMADGKTAEIANETFWRADGNSLPVRLGIRPIIRDGEIIGSVVSFNDNTERQQIEVAREKARIAAEAANRAKTAFLANMSHELRTPMTAIMGMSSLALRRTTDPQLREQLGKIDQASHHLLAVINSILDIAKIEAERFTLETTCFELATVVSSTDNLLAGKAVAKGIVFSIEVPDELARRPLGGDPLRLGQVLLNLAGNAIKFTEVGSVRVRVRIISETASELALRWEVRDTGIGIARQDQERLFQAFEQADNSMTRKYGGTGLGLAICKRLVELMGGTIGLESEPGMGSTFWFTCRFEKMEGAVPPAPSFQAEDSMSLAAFPGIRVLLAEDEPISQEVLRGLLEDVGMEVDIADDGAAAVKLARNHRYAIILMDMQMPVMNGLDATREIRNLPGYAEIPILATTANAFAEDRTACLAAGMNDHLIKPINPALLYANLSRWLA